VLGAFTIKGAAAKAQTLYGLAPASAALGKGLTEKLILIGPKQLVEGAGGEEGLRLGRRKRRGGLRRGVKKQTLLLQDHGPFHAALKLADVTRPALML